VPALGFWRNEVIAAVICALLASGAMVMIARGLVRVSENTNQAEADYRYVLTRLRENGESVALDARAPARPGVTRVA
jgi:ABC-type uncharacterized transport system fused permease/ATPase subunit